jgi:CDP-diacylglycerol---glycerol-3-phosphate 3-phosphatidyltransferase
MNLPNQLTAARFVMALAFVALMSFHNVYLRLIAYVLFVAASITDYYDGKIARERGLITNFGKLLDPVADKVLLVGALIMLMEMSELRVPGWTVVVIVAREFLITGVRSLAATGGVVIAADFWGKTKAVIQIIFVLVFMALAVIAELLETFAARAAWIPSFLAYYNPALREASFIAVVLVASFTIFSGFQFIRLNWRNLHLGM